MSSKIIFFSLICLLLSQTFLFKAKATDFMPISFFYSQMRKQANDKLQQQLVEAQTQFSFKLFSEISQDKLSENLFVSPSSVAIALSLLYNGAGGQTQQEMAQLLGFQEMTLQEVNLAYQQLQKTLETTDQRVKVHLANSLWARQGISFRHQFLRNNREYLGAEITNLNFSNSQSVGIINRWVSQQTQGKITEIIEQISPENILFLINAIYFKGEWQIQFDPEQTQWEDFYLDNDQSKEHPFMSQRGRFLYQETEQFQGISLPYSNNQWRFYVFLPKEHSSLKTFISQLNQENWTTWINNFRQREGLLELPRFQSKYEIELSSILQSLGLKSAFKADQADFSQMTSNSVVVDGVKHKTFIEVNEEGTEAAAVTSVGIRTTSAMPSNEPFEMIVNRPFFYSIVHEETGTILFMGTMVNPSD